jgi:maltose alpha-D-glucosyltransferase/alpha-amylase
MSKEHVVDLVEKGILPSAQEMIGAYLASAELLGRRTAELHSALASDPDDPAFSPEPFTPFYRSSLFQSIRALTRQAFGLLRKRLEVLPNGVQADATKVLDLEKEVYRRFRSILDLKITGMRTRHHGDYHLGQVLYTGKDFVITDFEGEPARAISERRLKRSPLRDVAGMLRSFNYAALFALRSGSFRPEDVTSLEPWSRFWNLWVSVGFLKSYLDVTANGGLLPKSKEELKTLLDVHILEKAVYELSYELNNRPDWVDVPIRGILEIVQPAG